jgi:4-amino-4-deoxy-L-arabinose transferase-like glycosyltransferase
MFGITLEFSSRIISTDVPLVFFWALALWAYINLLERASWPWAATLGVSIGLGLLAKYALGYFLLGMLLAAVFDRSARDLLRNRLVWLAFGIAVVIVLPNLVWLLHHNFVSFRSVAIAGPGRAAGCKYTPSPRSSFWPPSLGCLVRLFLQRSCLH